ncbi:NgoMIV family type II restriction endonuclease [Pseudonocardia terrae]|uniref:NgoMIV family type II restriction endonuclease n=1 Tax=Pseudonocardia terrae TaxID=2905831 RepID=UPI001E5A4075|nr:NgoMIV family type II restriction endonuclease [Pseudonocardia terrae]
MLVDGEARFVSERRRFHTALLASGVLTVSDNGVASNADSGSKASKAYALHIAKMLNSETGVRRLAGQTSGGQFEQLCADFLSATFPRLEHLRPGNWTIRKIGGRGPGAGVAQYEQYRHLVELTRAVEENPSLRTVLGNGYAIAPDVVVSRAPVADDEINTPALLVDGSVATRASLRAAVQPQEILHAVISCKWTLRSDRAQNARSEALNLIRNRKGRLPHIAVVTGEPTPARISSLALGTGDLDCVYHFALPELIDAVQADGGGDTAELLDTMIQGNRLKDIADLPLDLAV